MPITLSGRFVLNSENEETIEPKATTEQRNQMEKRPLLQVVLYRPVIPQNTGNVARTCAATHTPLNLIEPLGFRLTDRYLKRAGLDYWPSVSLRVYQSMEALRGELPGCRWIYFSTHGRRRYYEFKFLPGDCLVFGSETKGLPSDILESEDENVLSIPIDRSKVRSLNLATTVGAALFEALRQLVQEHDEKPSQLLSCGCEINPNNMEASRAEFS